MGNWIVAGLLAVIVFFIIRYLVKQRKNGGCGCGCSSCSHCPQNNSGCCKDKSSSNKS